MITIILVIVAVAIVLFLVIVAMQPADYRIARSTTIAASPASVFAHINDLHKWDAWSPWAKLDPSMKQTYDGPPSGVGATRNWSGNKKVGEGRMTITESRPTDCVRLRLEFFKPFKDTSMTEFTLQSQGNLTAVTWSMTGTRNFMFKAVCMFMNMDKMIGGDFERGLSQMKSIVESAA